MSARQSALGRTSGASFHPHDDAGNRVGKAL